jgi:[ribosomal protein S18]-alanine N-acetyltransferase
VWLRRGYYPADRATHPSGREDATVMSFVLDSQAEGGDALE